jgi:hypothetical protein
MNFADAIASFKQNMAPAVQAFESGLAQVRKLTPEQKQAYLSVGTNPYPDMEIMAGADFGYGSDPNELYAIPIVERREVRFGPAFGSATVNVFQQLQRELNPAEAETFLSGGLHAVDEMKGGLAVLLGGPFLGTVGTAILGAGVVEGIGAGAVSSAELTGAGVVVTPVGAAGAPAVIGTATGGGAFVDAVGVALPAAGAGSSSLFASGLEAGGTLLKSTATSYTTKFFKDLFTPKSALATGAAPAAAPGARSSADAGGITALLALAAAVFLAT